MPNYIFALHDSDTNLQRLRAMFPIKASDANLLNGQGYGIFRTVQSFRSEVRRADNLEKIVSYAIDLDDSSKEEQSSRIKRIGVEPSRIVETKNGFHIYFDLDGDGQASLYTSFLEEYLIPLYNACLGSKDVSRVLRVPGFYHCKDPENKFMVKLVYSSPIKYKEQRLFEIMYDKFKALKKEFLLFSQSELRTFSSIPPNTIKKSAREIADALGCKERSGKNYKVICPAHIEKNASLNITQAPDKVLFKCFGNCSQEKVLSKLKELGLW
jgi:hypothetical protein